MTKTADSFDRVSELPGSTGNMVRAPLVAAIGLASAVLYGIAYFAQRSLHLNGLLVEYPGFSYGGTRAANPTDAILEVGAYVFAVLALSALYFILIARARMTVPWTKAARVAAIAIPICLNLVMLLGRPYLSQDSFSYLAHGYLTEHENFNPYLTSTADVAVMPPGPQLAEFGWRPLHWITPYGPLWTWLERFAYLTASDRPAADTLDVAFGVFLVKVLAVIATFGTAWLMWYILGRLRPDRQLFGTVLFLWNPVIIVEFALEGHNDAIMLFFIVAALALTLASRSPLSVLATGTGALVKFLPLIFLPAQGMYLLRRHPVRWKGVVGAISGGLLAIGAGAFLYGSFWAGADTFGGLRHNSRWLRNSLGAMLHGGFNNWFGEELAITIISALLTGSFLIFVLYRSWQIRDEDGFLEECVWIALIFVLVASPLYWAWYAALPITLIALTRREIFLGMVPVLTVSSRLIAILPTVRINEFIGHWTDIQLSTVIGVIIPLGFLMYFLRSERKRRPIG